MTKNPKTHGPKRATGTGYAARPQLHAITINRKGETHHFFASSLGRWTVSYDLQGLVTRMKSDGLPFNVYLVPGPENRPYEIDYFTPKVEGVQWLAFYGMKSDLADAEERAKAIADKEA